MLGIDGDDLGRALAPQGYFLRVDQPSRSMSFQVCVAFAARGGASATAMLRPSSYHSEVLPLSDDPLETAGS